MFIPNNSHIDIAKQKSTDLQEEAKKVRLLNQVRPSLKIRVAQQLHKLAHKLEPSLHSVKPLPHPVKPLAHCDAVLQEC